VLLGIPRSARCVQRLDDSLCSAIHISYRISLRSSSMREPRDPLLKVVLYIASRHIENVHGLHQGVCGFFLREVDFSRRKVTLSKGGQLPPSIRPRCTGVYRRTNGRIRGRALYSHRLPASTSHPNPNPSEGSTNNDPSAGSPTETLLRLLLPLNDQVWATFRLWGAVSGPPRSIRRPH
jgi:hypothetical protein